MNIKFNDLGKQWDEIKEEVFPILSAFLSAGNYIGGDLLSEFESSFANYSNKKYAIGVSLFEKEPFSIPKPHSS